MKYILILALNFVAVLNAGILNYQDLMYPGSTLTNAVSVNDSRAVVGNYWCLTCGNGAYLWQSGAYSAITVPGARSTEADGINNVGQIVGAYIDSPGTEHGYLLSGGSFTQLDFPDSMATVAAGINDLGQIVGNTNLDGVQYAFLLSGGTYSLLSIPGSASVGAVGINSAGQISGYYQDGTSSHVLHGFVLSGTIFQSIQCVGYEQTQAGGINDAGEAVVSTYNFAPGGGHGFLSTDGCGGSISYPGSTFSAALGINNLDDVVGDYITGGQEHGFIALDPPNSATTPEPTYFLMTGAALLLLSMRRKR